MGSMSLVVSSRKAITVPRAALPVGRYYLLTARDSNPCQRALPHLYRSYRLMRQTYTLSLPSAPLMGTTCRESLPVATYPLLGVGPSRHYLRNPCMGAWPPTPSRPHGARTRFFPQGNGLTLEIRSSARKTHRHNATSAAGLFRGCRHFVMFRLPYLLGPQVAPTVADYPQGSRAVYTTHSSVGYLPRDVVSLRVQHEQLTRRDSHPLDCGLVGRSDFPSPVGSQ